MSDRSPSTIHILLSLPLPAYARQHRARMPNDLLLAYPNPIGDADDDDDEGNDTKKKVLLAGLRVIRSALITGDRDLLKKLEVEGILDMWLSHQLVQGPLTGTGTGTGTPTIISLCPGIDVHEGEKKKVEGDVSPSKSFSTSSVSSLGLCTQDLNIVQNRSRNSSPPFMEGEEGDEQEQIEVFGINQHRHTHIHAHTHTHTQSPHHDASSDIQENSLTSESIQAQLEQRGREAEQLRDLAVTQAALIDRLRFLLSSSSFSTATEGVHSGKAREEPREGGGDGDESPRGERTGLHHQYGQDEDDNGQQKAAQLASAARIAELETQLVGAEAERNELHDSLKKAVAFKAQAAAWERRAAELEEEKGQVEGELDQVRREKEEVVRQLATRGGRVPSI